MSETNIYKVDPVTGQIYNPGIITSVAAGIAENKIENIQDNQFASTEANSQKTLEFLHAMQERGKMSKEAMDKLASGENKTLPWPHAVGTAKDPELGTQEGFMPPILITPNATSIKEGQTLKEAQYKWEDWRGAKLEELPDKIDVEKRFKLSKDFPKKNSNLPKDPYSMRDVPLIFSDSRQDYFKNGLQVLDNLGVPLKNETIDSKAILSQYKGTPFENNDPVMFGFDIIIDDISSPLLNGSIIDFITQYNSINEIAARKYVYEDFKNQFIKFFRTKGTVRINAEDTYISRTNTNPANIDTNINLNWPGKKAYMGYYLKRIQNLELLSESNKGDTYKYLPDYRKDLISLEFFEDVSLSLGTLAHLYKLLYWSKPNGKSMIPDNLLRFNCDIIISECRNFVRTKKNVESGNLEILKDNLSRHVFQLRDCQFWFDKSVVPNEVDIGGQGPSVYDIHTIHFDFKYVTERFEKFVPSGNWGSYVGYNAGAIWKIGNAGERENRNTDSAGTTKDSSIPKFLTVGKNSLTENGVDLPYIIKVVGPGAISDKAADLGETLKAPSVDAVKEASEKAGEEAAKTAEEAKKSGIPSKGGNVNVMKTTSESSTGFMKALGSVPGASALKKSLTENTAGKLQTTLNVGVGNVLNSLREGDILKAKDSFGLGVGNLKDSFSQKGLENAYNAIGKGAGQAKAQFAAFAINETITGLGGGVADLKKSIAENKENKEREKQAKGTSDVKNKELEKEISDAKDATPDGGASQTRQDLLNQTIEKVSDTPGGTTPIMGPQTYEDYLGQSMDFLGPSLGGQLFG